MSDAEVKAKNNKNIDSVSGNSVKSDYNDNTDTANIEKVLNSSFNLILPTFISNEQNHSHQQNVSKKRIQSSPAKAQRRFSQDSEMIRNKAVNVSRFYGLIIIHIHTPC